MQSTDDQHWVKGTANQSSYLTATCIYLDVLPNLSLHVTLQLFVTVVVQN